MSTEIQEAFGEHNTSLTEYYGGKDKGLCIQITGENCDKDLGYVGLTIRDAYELIGYLAMWIKGVSEQKAQALRAEIAKNEELEKTILSDAVECQHFIDDLKILDIPLKLLGA